MTLDLTKPIRRRDDGREARVLATDLPGTHPIVIGFPAKECGAWLVDCYGPVGASVIFENVPPPQDWRWRWPDGSLSKTTHPDARTVSAVAKAGNWEGEPVRILREGEEI